MKFYEYVERMKDTLYTEDIEYSMRWGALLSRVNEWPVNVKSIGDSSEIIKIPRYHESERYKRYVPVSSSEISVCLARWGILLPVVTDLKQAVSTREWIICLMVEAKQGIGKNCMKKAWWDRRTGRNRDGF